ncbi:putative transcriptional activator NphR [Streptomyces aurantiacus JA 4570]|uniref:Putative transcriptional activator NphR n=1 Tax=Streptomyces aurantiacus JA 4570 TaxID=1286094 RepID=S3ZFE7_9ACTN|nr:putative transcriptional activator NphR [Streptomyces aurantiacus JA 4570]
MLLHVFDSQGHPAVDRVEAWRAVTASALIPNEFSVERASDFHASLRAAEMGAVQVTAMTYASMKTRRTPRLIRRSDPEMYAVGLILQGRQGILQERCEAACQAGDLVVYSTSHPFETVVDAQCGPAASVVAQIPRAQVPLSPDRLDRVLASRIPGRQGVGRVLASFLTTVATDTGPYRPADAGRLGHVLTDLITAWLCHVIDTEGGPAGETGHRVRVLEIQDFIRRHLGDAELTPGSVAAAHHISLRGLHRLFRHHAHGVTVASYVKGQRLERARRDLADPSLAARPVHAIAARWGFGRPADFTRAFRAAYGTTPTEYRHTFLRAVPGTQR